MPAVVSSGSGPALAVPGAAATRNAPAGPPGGFRATLAAVLAPTPTPVTGQVATGADPSAGLPTGTTDAGLGSVLAGGLLAFDAPDSAEASDVAEACDAPDRAGDSDTVDAANGGIPGPSPSLAQQVPPFLMTVPPATAATAAAVAAEARDGQGVAGVTASGTATTTRGATGGATPAGASVPWVAAPDGAATSAATTAAPSAPGPAVPPATRTAAPDRRAAAPTAEVAVQAPAGSAAPTATSPLPPVGSAPTDAPSGPAAVVAATSAVPAQRTTDPSAAPGAQPVAALAAPAVSTTSVVTGPAAATPSAPATTPQAFAEQLSRPVLRLATGSGDHVLTVRVSPEHLGPVTVQAHIGADGVRIELFSATDAGRAAVHAALPDLRRDLAGTGLGASLDLSDRSYSGAPAHDPGAGQGRGDRGEAGGQGSGAGRPDVLPRVAAASGPDHHTSTPSQPSPTVAVLDVLA